MKPRSDDPLAMAISDARARIRQLEGKERALQVSLTTARQRLMKLEATAGTNVPKSEVLP